MANNLNNNEKSLVALLLRKSTLGDSPTIETDFASASKYLTMTWDSVDHVVFTAQLMEKMQRHLRNILLQRFPDEALQGSLSATFAGTSLEIRFDFAALPVEDNLDTP